MKILIRNSEIEKSLGDLVGNWRPSGKYSSQYFYNSYEISLNLPSDRFSEILKEFEENFGYSPSISCFSGSSMKDSSQRLSDILHFMKRVGVSGKGSSDSINFGFAMTCLPNTKELFDLLGNSPDGTYLAFPTVSVFWRGDDCFRISFSLFNANDARKNISDQKDLKKVLSRIQKLSNQYSDQGWNLEILNKRGSEYRVWQDFASLDSTVSSLKGLIDEIVGCLSEEWFMSTIGSGDHALVFEFLKSFSTEPLFVKAESCLLGTCTMYDRRKAFESFRHFRMKSLEIPIAVVNDSQREIWFGLRIEHDKTFGVAYGSSAKGARTLEIVKTYFPDSRIEVVEE